MSDQTLFNYAHTVKRPAMCREGNPFWKGGRTISSTGYVLIRVGTEHHLADVRGYAYEHRIVAEKKIGRRLLPGEQVHHVNGDKQDNREENLQVMKDIRHHRAAHRNKNRDRWTPDTPNLMISCACGCGVKFKKYDTSCRVRRFVSGHNQRRVREFPKADATGRAE